MSSAEVYCRSRTGITQKLADNIAAVLTGKGLSVRNTPIPENGLTESTNAAANAEVILLGCWTGGLIFFLQHPDKQWKEFAQSLPPLDGKKVCLFATYKVATGSMFKRMEQQLQSPGPSDILILRSKNGTLSAEDTARLEQWAGA